MLLKEEAGLEDSSEAYHHSSSCGLDGSAALQGQMGFGRAERNGLVNQTYWKLLVFTGKCRAPHTGGTEVVISSQFQSRVNAV